MQMGLAKKSEQRLPRPEQVAHKEIEFIKH